MDVSLKARDPKEIERCNKTVRDARKKEDRGSAKIKKVTPWLSYPHRRDIL